MSEQMKEQEELSRVDESGDSTLRATAAGWQPIATAPKDGTVVIGFDPTRDDDDGLPHGVDFMRWFDGAWIDPLTHSLRPTHWMPLPAPPAETT